DPGGMVRMFERLENMSRLNQRGGNVYTSTHPLSVQRMSDAQNRAMGMAQRPNVSSDGFWYVRAKLRIEQARAGQAVRSAEDALRAEVERETGVQRSAAWFGLAYAASKRRDFDQAEQALQRARAEGHEAPQIAALEISLTLARGDADRAFELGRQAMLR